MVCQVLQVVKDKREVQDEMACLDRTDCQVHEERWDWMGLLAERSVILYSSVCLVSVKNLWNGETLCIVLILIYLLTAIGLSPGTSTHLRTNNTYWHLPYN